MSKQQTVQHPDTDQPLVTLTYNHRWTECDRCHHESSCTGVDWHDGSGEWDYCDPCLREVVNQRTINDRMVNLDAVGRHKQAWKGIGDTVSDTAISDVVAGELVRLRSTVARQLYKQLRSALRCLMTQPAIGQTQRPEVTLYRNPDYVTARLLAVGWYEADLLVPTTPQMAVEMAAHVTEAILDRKADLSGFPQANLNDLN
jgi:hypothetical protein